MALTSKIPPQAYTRDTLVKAIEWLSAQPPAVRERANSADLIVSHYLQARRQTAGFQVEASVSQESFKADLKHLAEDLKRFDDQPSAPPPSPARSPSYVVPSLEEQQELLPQALHAKSHRSFFRPEPTRANAPVAAAPAPSPSPVTSPPVTQAAPSHTPVQPALPVQQQLPLQPMVTPTPSPYPDGPVWQIDPRSLAVARELQDRLNLSSEGEAIRLLITMGAERARGTLI